MANFNENIIENGENIVAEINDANSIDVKVVIAIATGVTILVGGGVVLGKKVIKPMWDNHKAKKNGITITQGVEPEIEAENVEVNDKSK